MKKRWILFWAPLLLVIPVLAWMVIGSIVGYKVSQREETRHARFVNEYRDPTKKDWLSVQKKQKDTWLTWTYTTPEHTSYKVRLFADHTYLVVVHLSGFRPNRIEEGKASPKAWAALEAALENPENLDQSVSKKHMEPTVVIKFDRGWASFYAKDYHQLAPEVRKLDEAIAGVIAGASLRPPRRYARVPEPVTFQVANLVRGLESDHADAFPHIVGHLTAIGKTALPEMERVLEASSPRDEVSRKRIKALIDGLEDFPEVHARVLPKVREIAAATPLNGRLEESTRRAAKFARDVVVRKYQQEAFERRGLAFTPYANPPSEELRRIYQRVVMQPRRGRADSEALVQELVDLGPDIIPLLLESLENGGVHFFQLMDALAAIGGPDAILLARKMEVVSTEACVRPLAKMGVEAIPALLFLLEIGEHYTSGISTVFAKDPDSYRCAIPPIRDMLERRRGLYREATNKELRVFHRDGIRKLIGMLMALDAKDPRTVQILCDMALDTKQDKNIRRSALELLRRIGTPAAIVVDVLKEQAGYEASGMRGEFLKTARALSGDPE